MTRPAQRRLLLMADYGCWPLWEPGADPYQLTPHDLPLSGALRRRLTAWAEAFDATLNWEDPARSDFPDETARQAFHAEGLRSPNCSARNSVRPLTWITENPDPSHRLE
ncbi:hypothetical protein [Deinococcus sp. JMULE3]|uniref:hypothetical protein n=1 Tax=Deinococcus sp. JMULE3 TaxID=2518341 RepID=UPI0015772AF4|nr:hypothetical protein [Deinococcus sp. JMULE3]NTY02254.1 hypothetical protein [Deinococcus sp. JMULE3]